MNSRPFISEETRIMTRTLYLLFGGLPERIEEGIEAYFAEQQRFPLMQMQTFLNRHPDFRPKDWGQTAEERAVLAQYGPATLNRPKGPGER